RRLAPLLDPPVPAPLDLEEVAAGFGRQLLGREVPGRRGEGEALGLLLDHDRRVALGDDLVPFEHALVLLAAVAGGLEDERRGAAAEADRELLARPEQLLALQPAGDREKDLGGGAGRLPVPELLVEEEPLDEPLVA